MFRKSLSYFKIAAKTLVSSSELLYKPGVNAVRQLTKQTGENILEMNSLPGAKFSNDNLAVFGREVNQALVVVANEFSQRTKAYSQLLANNIVSTAKELGKKAGILNNQQNVKECIMEYLIQNLAEYTVSLHMNNENKNCVGDYTDIKHIPVKASAPLCMVSLLVTPLVNRLFTLGVENAHELAYSVYQVLVECKEKLAEQLYVADLDNYAYQITADEIIAYGKSSYGPKVGADTEVRKKQFVQQYRDSHKTASQEDQSKIVHSISVPELDNAPKYSPF